MFYMEHKEKRPALAGRFGYKGKLAISPYTML